MIRSSVMTLMTLVILLPATSAQDLPDGAELMDRYVEVTGGKEAYLKLKNRQTKGTLLVIPAGIGGTISTYEDASNQTVRETEIINVDTAVEGVTKYNGEFVVWSLSNIQGANLITGTAREQQIRAAKFQSDVNWRELYDTAETTGEKDVDGTSCYVVKLTAEGQDDVTYYLGVDSGLLLQADANIESPMGTLAVSSKFSEYQEFDGIKVATKLEQTLPFGTITLNLESIEHNIDPPADIFELPAEIKELVDN